MVKKGDVLCELDAAALQDRLINQRITRESAKANFQNAKLAREEAEIEASWFQDELYPREKREVEGEVKVAESEVVVGEAELKEVKSIGGNNELALKRADLAIARARLALEKAKNRLHILTHYTKDHRTKELVIEVEKTRSNELAKQSHLGAGEEQGGEAGTADRRLHDHRPDRRHRGLCRLRESGCDDESQPRLLHIEVGASVRAASAHLADRSPSHGRPRSAVRYVDENQG